MHKQGCCSETLPCHIDAAEVNATRKNKRPFALCRGEVQGQ